MPIPDSPRVVYENNPLQKVICQLRFPTILSIAAEQPAAFQEQIRDAYPIYERESSLVVPEQLRDVLRNVKLANASDAVRHAFRTADGQRALFLAQDFLALEEERYSRWEAFSSELARALAALQSHYKPSFFSRVGLRYQDVVDRSTLPDVAGEPWTALIRAELLGLVGSAELGAEVTGFDSTSVLKLTEVPGAFARVSSSFVARKDHAGEVGLLVDTDFFVENQTPTSDAHSILSEFNRIAGRLFRWAILDRLKMALRPSAL